jgi:hypothetical protein
MKQIRTLFLAIAFLFCLYILIYQTEWLGIVLFEKLQFPLGTLISWFMIVDLNYFVYSIFPFEIQSNSMRIMKKSIKAFSIISIFWGVFSYLLAGNWQWSFNNMTYFIIWIIITFIFVVYPLVVTVFLVFKRILKN